MEFRRKSAPLPFSPVDTVHSRKHRVDILSYGENKAGLYAPSEIQHGHKNKCILPDNFIYVFYSCCRYFVVYTRNHLDSNRKLKSGIAVLLRELDDASPIKKMEEIEESRWSSRFLGAVDICFFREELDTSKKHLLQCCNPFSKEIQEALMKRYDLNITPVDVNLFERVREAIQIVLGVKMTFNVNVVMKLRRLNSYLEILQFLRDTVIEYRDFFAECVEYLEVLKDKNKQPEAKFHFKVCVFMQKLFTN